MSQPFGLARRGARERERVYPPIASLTNAVAFPKRFNREISKPSREPFDVLMQRIVEPLKRGAGLQNKKLHSTSTVLFLRSRVWNRCSNDKMLSRQEPRIEEIMSEHRLRLRRDGVRSICAMT